MPTSVLANPADSAPIIFATPRSPIFASPFLSRKMFSDLTSRWRMCLEWMWERPRQHCSRRRHATGSGTRPRGDERCVLMSSRTVPRGAYSMTMHSLVPPSATKDSWYLTTCGLSSLARTRHSLMASSCDARRGPIAICFRQKVRRRESPRSRRRVTAHTTPNEPSPSLRTTSKSAILVTLERGATTFGGLAALGADAAEDETRAEASPSGIARGARAFDRGARTRMTRRTRATATATARGRARAETHRERGEGRRGRSGEGRRGRDPRRETTSARPAAGVSDNAKR